MYAHRVEAIVADNGTVILKGLPFEAGVTVEILVLPSARRLSDDQRYPLRGTPLRYENPTAPIAEEDWEALR